MNVVDSDIKAGKFHRCYLITGSEDYLVRFTKNKLVKALVKPDDKMNYTELGERELNSADIRNVTDIVMTMPFFAERRVVILQNSGFFKNSNDMADFLPKIPESTVLIFEEKEVDKRNRLYKAVQKYGAVIVCDPFSNPDDLLTWTGAYLARSGRKITKQNARYLLDRIGTDMYTITGECEKLISYTYGRDEVTVPDIDAVTEERPEDQIFKMMDAIGHRDQKKALECYYDLLRSGEAPIKILFMLNRHFHILLQIKDLMKNGRESEAAALLKIPPFTVRNYTGQAKQFSEKALLDAFSSGVDTDEAIKSGRAVDRIAVESLIVKFSAA